ncbi:Histidine phosphatase superfamily [Macleaya cordata]|uniref:Histidine phosphatase superfamily n=1 Tax=Macleaya cordata TaxID=56857 RepID=A0A200R784_MACCD|nr:Histidine phosphatase superfamily [Macleaya cordata]
MAAACVVISSNEPQIDSLVTKRSSEDQTELLIEIPFEDAEIVVVRHGETTWNASGRIQGQLESELNEVGLKQAVTGGGESFNQLCERSVAALEEIASKHKGERVVVVTHGGVLRAVSMAVTGEASAGKIMNASINALHLKEKKWVFKALNDVSHLDEIGFLEQGFNGDALQN